MDKEVMCFEVNKGICEAYGCFESATTKINVKVGKVGSISLDLCAGCVKKFDIKEQSSSTAGSITLGGLPK
jgi:hypothetical protein